MRIAVFADNLLGMGNSLLSILAWWLKGTSFLLFLSFYSSKKWCPPSCLGFPDFPKWTACEGGANTQVRLFCYLRQLTRFLVWSLLFPSGSPPGASLAVSEQSITPEHWLRGVSAAHRIRLPSHASAVCFGDGMKDGDLGKRRESDWSRVKFSSSACHNSESHRRVVLPFSPCVGNICRNPELLQK